MVFGFGRKLAGALSREVKAEYGQNKDFLEATCAVVALVAFADGQLENEEKDKAKKVITGHAQLSKIYNSSDIESTMETMFKRAESFSGRQALLRELDDVKDKGAQMGEDCYLVGLDIAHADGELEEAEAKVLTQIANRLNVDLKKLGLQD
jgi:tellurite resistance protein